MGLLWPSTRDCSDLQTVKETGVSYSYAEISKMIDHSLLRPTLTVEELEQGCQLAVKYDVASVCILPYYLSRCAELLAGSDVKASTTVGFPHGGHCTDIKAGEAERALADGAEELDMVVNISKVLSEDWNYVREEIGRVTEIAHSRAQKVKVIFENCYLEETHKIRLCKICGEVGADWIKTSTGYGSGGATLDDLRLMCKYAGPGLQVKAAGGVRDLDRLLTVREIGVTRVGASATVKILDECRQRLQSR